MIKTDKLTFGISARFIWQTKSLDASHLEHFGHAESFAR